MANFNTHLKAGALVGTIAGAGLYLMRYSEEKRENSELKFKWGEFIQVSLAGCALGAISGVAADRIEPALNPEWERGAQEWLKAHIGEADANNASLVIGPPPTESCPGRSAQNFANSPKITITSPGSNSYVTSGSKIPVQVMIQAPTGINRVEYYLDNEFKYKTVTAPYEGLIRLPYGEQNGTHHIITAKIFDNGGYVGVTNVDINIDSTTAMNNVPNNSGTTTNNDIYGTGGTNNFTNLPGNINVPGSIIPVSAP